MKMTAVRRTGSKFYPRVAKSFYFVVVLYRKKVKEMSVELKVLIKEKLCATSFKETSHKW